MNIPWSSHWEPTKRLYKKPWNIWGGSVSLAFLCKPGEPPEVVQYRRNRGVKTAGSFPPIFARNAVMLIFIEFIGCLLGKKHHFCGRKSLARRADDVALGLNAAISRTSTWLASKGENHEKTHRFIDDYHEKSWENHPLMFIDCPISCPFRHRISIGF